MSTELPWSRFRFLYGQGAAFVDVTATILRDHCRDGRIELIAAYHNGLFGDPLPEVAKVLRIEESGTHRTDIAENGSFSIDADGAISATDFIFLHGTEGAFVNVTRTIFERCLKGGSIVVSGSYRELFADHAPHRRKQLRIQSPNRTTPPVDVAADVGFRMKARWEAPAFPAIAISYFINTTLTARYRHILASQLNELQASGLLALHGTTLTVSCVAAPGAQATLRRLIGGIVPQARVDFVDGSHFEYPGILQAWRESFANDGLTLYFHAKGITHVRRPTARRSRTRQERFIFEQVINHWADNLWALWQFDSIDKLGMSAGDEGWIWFNFWWARNSYLRRCAEPLPSEIRHYYEHWLCRADAPRTGMAADNCFSLTGRCHIGLTYGATEASALAPAINTRTSS